MAVRVVTDSAAGLPAEDLRRLSIGVVPLHIRDGDTLRPENSVGPDELDRLLDDARSGRGHEVGTSQPTPDEFAAAFRDAASAGADVLAVLISAKMSGTVNAAQTAAAMLGDAQFPAHFGLVDSESNSMQEGYAVLAAAEAAAAGGTLDECMNAARSAVARTRFLFVPHSLEDLRRGGRISRAAALLGSVLQLRPVLTAEDGTTAVAAKVRTTARALQTMADIFRADVARCGLRRVAVQHILQPQEAAAFADALIEPIARMKVPVIPIPAIVGLHVGPALGVVYETIEPLR